MSRCVVEGRVYNINIAALSYNNVIEAVVVGVEHRNVFDVCVSDSYLRRFLERCFVLPLVKIWVERRGPVDLASTALSACHQVVVFVGNTMDAMRAVQIAYVHCIEVLFAFCVATRLSEGIGTAAVVDIIRPKVTESVACDEEDLIFTDALFFHGNDLDVQRCWDVSADGQPSRHSRRPVDTTLRVEPENWICGVGASVAVYNRLAACILWETRRGYSILRHRTPQIRRFLRRCQLDDIIASRTELAVSIVPQNDGDVGWSEHDQVDVTIVVDIDWQRSLWRLSCPKDDRVDGGKISILCRARRQVQQTADNNVFVTVRIDVGVDQNTRSPLPVAFSVLSGCTTCLITLRPPTVVCVDGVDYLILSKTSSFIQDLNMRSFIIFIDNELQVD